MLSPGPSRARWVHHRRDAPGAGTGRWGAVGEGVQGHERALAAWGDVATEVVTLDGHADSAADVAAGFCTGTPLRMEIAARGDLEAGTRAVAAQMPARLGDGRVTAPMTAYVVEARPSLRPPA